MQGAVKITIIAAIGVAVIGFAIYMYASNLPVPPASPTVDDVPSVISNASTVTTPTNQTGILQKKEVVLSAMLTGNRWDNLLQAAER
ncbi:MAG: hypothetical protein ACRD99_01340, partial [Nitrososphaera sp.]